MTAVTSTAVEHENGGDNDAAAATTSATPPLPPCNNTPSLENPNGDCSTAPIASSPAPSDSAQLQPPAHTSATPPPTPATANPQHQYHKLEHTWRLYILSGAEKKTQESWSRSQTEVHSFSTVEDFWCLATHMKPPSHIGVSDYSLFKERIKPEWEDPAVAQGGRWVAKFATKVKELDDIWLHVVMAMIGETLHMTLSDCICGAVVSMRPRSFKLSIWLAIRDKDFVADVGREFKEILMRYLDTKESKLPDITFQSFTGHAELRLSPEGGLEEVVATAGSSAERSGVQQHPTPTPTATSQAQGCDTSSGPNKLADTTTRADENLIPDRTLDGKGQQQHQQAQQLPELPSQWGGGGGGLV